MLNILSGIILGVIFFGLILVIFNNLKKSFNLIKIKSATQQFEKGATDEQVRQYIKAIENTNFPNHPNSWSTLRNGFNLVNNSKEVSYELKKELMNLINSKGGNLGNLHIKD